MRRPRRSIAHGGAALLAAVLAAVLALAAVPLGSSSQVINAPGGPAEASADGPAARQLDWLLAALNAGDRLEPTELKAHFTPAFWSPGMGWLSRDLARAARALAPLGEPVREPQRDPDKVIAIVSTRDGARRFEVDVDRFSAERIKSFWVVPVEPVDSNQTGGEVRDWIGGGTLAGAPVELVDRKTGRSLDPPVSTVTDFFGYIRLTVPGDPEKVSLRITRELLFARTETFVPVSGSQLGNDRFILPGLTRHSARLLAKWQGLPPKPGRGHLFGWIGYSDPSTQRVVGPVACTKVAVAGGSVRVIYPPNWLHKMDLKRSMTLPNSGRWWAVELAPGAYEVRIEAPDQAPRIVEAQVFPDAVTYLYTSIPLPKAGDTPPTPSCE